MATRVHARPSGYGYLGNSNHREVHYLPYEKVGCHINAIIVAGHGVVFSPDSLAQARYEGYDNCAHCIGFSAR